MRSQVLSYFTILNEGVAEAAQAKEPSRFKNPDSRLYKKVLQGIRIGALKDGK
jgi:hypothetical protein